MMDTGQFKVTDCGTDRKPICNFLFVNNTNLYAILDGSKLSQRIGQTAAFDRGACI